MTDSGGALVWDAQCRPFGEAHSITGTAQNDQRFSGQLHDVETSFHYNYFRDYDPSLGRYVQSDPIGLEGGLNTYAYVGGDPVSRTDPFGLRQGGCDRRNPWLCKPLDHILGGGGGGGPKPKPPRPDPKLLPPIPPGDPSGGTYSNVCSDDKPCPPCKTVSGKIVPVGTIAYRPMETPPEGKVEHGITGPHHNLYKANQAPKDSPQPCRCFWQSLRAVSPSDLPAGAIPIEPFVY